MKKFFADHVRLVAVIVVAIFIIGAVWYIAANGEPALGSYAIMQGNVSGALNEPATVSAVNNANLAFQESGQIAHVYVKEGDVVAAGAVLADLDSATLEAGVQSANAALASARAKLVALQTGATPQAIAVSQAALTSAQQSLANGYTGVSNTLNDAYSKANDAVRNQLAPFFSLPEGNNPQLTFSISDSNVLSNIQNTRATASAQLNVWQNELASATANPSANVLSADLTNAANHLAMIQNLLTLAGTAVTDEIGLSATTAATYKSAATTGLNEVNTAITEVSGVQQAIASEQAAVAQAQAGLNLTTASSTTQDIQEQQAAVAQAEAAAQAAQVALNNAQLTAPFPGTVQNLTAQVGQVVSPGAPVLSLVNNGALEVQAYVSESDVANIKVGDTANVTLDAFGTGTILPATVGAIDSAETVVSGTPSYLVTLYFTNAEPQVKDGMTGNVQIIQAEENGVIAIPSRLVLNDGNQNFVLLETTSGIQKQPVQVGLVGTDGMTQITSGLTATDTLANF